MKETYHDKVIETQLEVENLFYSRGLAQDRKYIKYYINTIKKQLDKVMSIN